MTSNEWRKLLEEPPVEHYLRQNRRYLVTDDICSITVKSSGEVVPFRLRIWRKKDHRSVLLVSTANGQQSHCKHSEKIARMAISNFLDFDPAGYFYFEVGQGKTVYSVQFTCMGNGTRYLPGRPTKCPIGLASVEDLVGEKIEA